MSRGATHFYPSCFLLVLSRAANQDKLLIPRMELEMEVQLLSTSIINKLGLPSAAGHLSLSRWHVSLAFRFRTEVKPKLLKFATTLSYHLLVALLEHQPLNHTASYISLKCRCRYNAYGWWNNSLPISTQISASSALRGVDSLLEN